MFSNELFSILILISSINADQLLIKTNNGYVNGQSVSLNKTIIINTWIGIPFAEKPINDLRFKRPVPIKNWSNILNATTEKSSCYQSSTSKKINEDCLYLNIYKKDNSGSNLPVIIWIHGGGFTIGSATDEDPLIFVNETNLIYVSISYRLSIFGFLYMENEEAPGNMGLLDQYLAIKWVYENIQYFGGDNSKITIYGESAGAKSVGLHLLSNLTSRYFRNAILSSGSPLADVVITKKSESIEKNQKILKSLGCSGSSQKLVECARKINPDLLLKVSAQYMNNQSKFIFNDPTFSPVVDDYFLVDMPSSLFNNGLFKKCSILTGVNKNEGILFLDSAFDIFKTKTAPVLNYSTFENLLTTYFYFYPKYPNISSSLVQNAIIYRYINWSDKNNSKYYSENLDYAVGDYSYMSPCIELSDFYSKNNQLVYQYYFTHQSSVSNHPDWWGVAHADELQFVYGKPLSIDSKYSDSDKKMSRMFINYWNNFVRYDNPNGPNENEWPEYNYSSRAFINLKTEPDIEYSLRADYSAFWNYYLPTLPNEKNLTAQKNNANLLLIPMNEKFFVIFSLLIIIF